MSWATQPERGGVLVSALMLWITRKFGWSTGQLLLYPITLWFFATSAASRAASRDYLRRVLGRPASALDVFRHFFAFASVILDRVFFLAGRTAAYEIRVEGLDALRSILDTGRGCILLGSHLGSFEVLRAFGRIAPVRVHPVMVRRADGRLTRMLEKLDPELAADVIEINGFDSMLQVQDCLERGEIVGFLADRSPLPERMVPSRFLGGDAEFPAGPLVVAAVVGAPVLLFYGIRIAPRRYLIRFEPFAEKIELPRSRRQQELEIQIGAYARSLAAHCARYPFNWFNFYPFWKPPRDLSGRG